mgnify:FL=1|tara:strand:+ start:319 stop:456 length:138 start_codon:yes stop_codon:yes gene_type:complete
MSKKEDQRMLLDTILLYKQKIDQTPRIKKFIQKLQQRLDKLNKSK